eukprot:10363256-Ditylum_brightwellii.AAC.1
MPSKPAMDDITTPDWRCSVKRKAANSASSSALGVKGSVTGGGLGIEDAEGYTFGGGLTGARAYVDEKKLH